MKIGRLVHLDYVLDCLFYGWFEVVSQVNATGHLPRSLVLQISATLVDKARPPSRSEPTVLQQFSSKKSCATRKEVVKAS